MSETSIPAASYEQEIFNSASAGRRRSREELVALLRTWIADRFESEDLQLLDPRTPLGAGTSSETVLATARWTSDGRSQSRDIAFRIAPDSFQLFFEPVFENQYRVLEILHREGSVAVPEPLYFESDTAILGLPFYVMGQVHGRVPVSSPPYNSAGFLFEATPAQRRVAWETAMDQLCRVAKVPVAQFTILDEPRYGESGLVQQLEYWKQGLGWYCNGEVPDEVHQLDEWLRSNIPPQAVNGFAWGDARIGNMAFDDTFGCVGVFDWEQANIGGIHQDLGWWLFFDHFHSEGRGHVRLEGLGSRAETISYWEDNVGQLAGDTRWYEIFAAYKVAILSIRSLLLVHDPNALKVESNPTLARACQMADLRTGT